MAMNSDEPPIEAGQDGVQALYVGDLKAVLENGLQGWLENNLALTTELESDYWPHGGEEDIELILPSGVWGLDWVSTVEEKGWDVAVVAPLVDAEEAIALFCAQQSWGNKVARDWLQEVAVSTTCMAIDAYRTFLLREKDAANPALCGLKQAYEYTKAMDIAERWGRVAARWCRARLLLARELGGGE